MSTDGQESPEPPEYGYLQSDEPITRRVEDRLNRVPLAEAIADQIIHSPPGQGFVIAIDGPWGSGKTSVLNMIEETVVEKSSAVILRFNPWLFSGTEQLVVRFLQEVSVQLGERAQGVDDEGLRARLALASERLGSYGEVLVPLGWVPVVGTWLARVGLLAKAASRKRKETPVPSVLAQRERVREALTQLDCRVVVIVDDLDRVEPEQIRDVVRLIKLVADFPNVTYLLAYDAEKVATALGKDGRAYLEKIVQVTHALPQINDWPLVVLLQTELAAALQSIEHGPFAQDDWVNVFHTGMRPFFENIRDVRRYLNAVPVTLRVLGDEVALVDALALETLRIFAPSAYAKLPALVPTLTGDESAGWRSPREREEQEAMDGLVAAAAPHEDATRQMIQRLFPRVGRYVGGTSMIGSGQDYRRKRRVAHPEVFRIYLRRTLPEGATPAALVQDAYESMGDRERFTDLLDVLDARQLEDLLGRLEDYERDYDPAAAEVAVAVLLNQMPRLREGRQGMLDGGADIALTRVVFRVLQTIDDEQELAALVRRALPRVRQLSGREELIDIVGHREHVGHRLISEADAAQLYREQNEQVLAADLAALAEERQLLRLFHRAREGGGDAARTRVAELLDDDGVLLCLLRSSYTEHQTQSMGNLAVRTVYVLPWGGIAEMVGSAERLKERVEEVAARIDRASLDPRTREAFETAERYASGELPRLDRYGQPTG